MLPFFMLPLYLKRYDDLLKDNQFRLSLVYTIINIFYFIIMILYPLMTDLSQTLLIVQPNWLKSWKCWALPIWTNNWAKRSREAHWTFICVVWNVYEISTYLEDFNFWKGQSPIWGAFFFTHSPKLLLRWITEFQRWWRSRLALGHYG